MNKVSMLRGHGVAVIACGIAVLIARPLNLKERIRFRGSSGLLHGSARWLRL